MGHEMMIENRNHPATIAAITASSVILVFGLFSHIVIVRLDGPATGRPVAPDALRVLPLEIGDWKGEDVVMDEAIVRAAGTDAHVSRRYSRKGGTESVEIFVACNFSACTRVIHRPEVCYPSSGWTTLENRQVELPLGDGTKLPCSLFRFSRGSLEGTDATVLHYYIADGQPYGNLSVIGPRYWRLAGRVAYVARVLINTSNWGLSPDSAETIVSDFAVDSAPPLAQLFEALVAERQSGDLRDTSKGK
jgi:hypothetical protein